MLPFLLLTPLSFNYFLFKSCQDKVDYYTQIESLVQKDHNKTVKAMDGNGILSSDRFLRDFLCMYLDEKSGLQQSLILCLMRAFISKANGHKNPQYDPKVKNFMLALAATNKQACDARVSGCGYLHQANMIVGGAYPRATSEPNEHFYGGAYPQHAIDVSSLSPDERQNRLTSLVNQEGDVNYATEVNMFLERYVDYASDEVALDLSQTSTNSW